MLKPNLSQIRYARYLDATHGRQVARRYLGLVTSPDYMSEKNVGQAKRSLSVANTYFFKKANCHTTTA